MCAQIDKKFEEVQKHPIRVRLPHLKKGEMSEEIEKLLKYLKKEAEWNS